MMETLTAKEARGCFGETLQKAQESPVQITRGGQPFAVLMSVEAYRMSEEMKLRELKRIIENGERELANGDFVDGKTFMQELIDGI